MSFDLKLHFIGLAMFVPEDDRMMHVLFPSTHHAHPVTPDQDGAHQHHAGCIEPHHMRIVYDAAYEQPGEPQYWRRYKFVDMEGRVLDLSGLPSEGGLDPRLPTEIARIDRVADPVPRDLVRSVGDPRLAGRLTVDSGALSNCSIGARFTLNSDQPERLTIRTEWTVRGIQTRRPATNGCSCLPGPVLRGADSTGDVRLPDLYPIGDAIHLMVFNAVASEFPPHGRDFLVPAPSRSTEPSHFPAYFTLSPKRLDVGDADSIPDLVDVAEVEVEGAVVPLQGPQSSTISCVQAQNFLEP